MGAEKKLQKLLDKANKGTGNTTEATDGRGEISDALVDSGKGRLVKKGKRLYDRMNKGSGIKMVSPLNFPGANSSNSTCWDGYRKDGVKDSPSGTGETVNNCVKIGSPAKQDYNEVNVQDLQDMGKVKKNKKGKYVVNENPKTVNDTLYIPKKFRSYTGKKLKVGEMIDESDYENLSNETN
tara:strand:- start:11 stop:553 length:543 start_codon:yes stop_codon:yes gene_type:complete